MSSARILLVDDDPNSLESTRKILELAHYEVVTATDGQAALDLIRPSLSRPIEQFDLVVTDVRMPRLGGLEFLRAISLCSDAVPVILMTAFGRVQDAVWAMKLGAVDFLTKPFKRQQLLVSVEAALKRARANAAVAGNTGVSTSTRSETRFDTLIGNSTELQSIRTMIRQVAPTAATVLIGGESGTGKEVAARAIHELSVRAAQPFIALNCAAVPENLIESELFGFDKGSFTGANQARSGLFEAAHQGTLLLDEIGDMPFALQSKLLRVLQEGEVRRVGATISKKVDVRLIAATHRNLHELVEQGRFRQDLLYRLEVVQIRMPALRERVADLPDLAYFFLKLFAHKHAKPISQISEEAMGLLLSHAWPGNIRELSNVLERSVIFAQSEQVEIADLPTHLTTHLATHLATHSATNLSAGFGAQSSLQQVSGQNAQSISVPLGTSLKDVEELLIRKTLEATSGDKNMTAKLLGINSRTIYRKLAENKEEIKEE
jgi:two-component system response regulator HydG